LRAYAKNPRTEAPGTADPRAPHTGYALQSGYEPLLRRLGRVTAQDIERMVQCFMVAGDASERSLASTSNPLTRVGPTSTDTLGLSHRVPIDKQMRQVSNLRWGGAVASHVPN
jgi:hypothetical protein